jgi:hypothetical protein
MLTLITQVRHPILIAVIALMAIGVVVFVLILGSKRKKSAPA